MKPYILILIYLIFISFLAVVLTCYDKYCAVRGKWRIKENTLLIVSLLGGSAAMYITMRIIRHKTRHYKFMIGIPIIFALQIIALVFCLVMNYG